MRTRQPKRKHLGGNGKDPAEPAKKRRRGAAGGLDILAEAAGAADDASSSGDEEDEDEEVEDDPEGRPLKAGTLRSYVNAISELYRHQVSTGENTNPPIRGPAVKALLQNRQRLQELHSQQNFDDPTLGDNYASYTREQLWQMQQNLLARAREEEIVSIYLFMLLISILTSVPCHRTFEPGSTSCWGTSACFAARPAGW